MQDWINLNFKLQYPEFYHKLSNLQADQNNFQIPEEASTSHGMQTTTATLPALGPASHKQKNVLCIFWLVFCEKSECFAFLRWCIVLKYCVALVKYFFLFYTTFFNSICNE